jgi:hypothetical protein
MKWRFWYLGIIFSCIYVNASLQLKKSKSRKLDGTQTNRRALIKKFLNENSSSSKKSPKKASKRKSKIVISISFFGALKAFFITLINPTCGGLIKYTNKKSKRKSDDMR